LAVFAFSVKPMLISKNLFSVLCHHTLVFFPSSLMLFVHCELLGKVLLLSELSAGPQVAFVVISSGFPIFLKYHNWTANSYNWTSTNRITLHLTFYTSDSQVCPWCSRK